VEATLASTSAGFAASYGILSIAANMRVHVRSPLGSQASDEVADRIVPQGPRRHLDAGAIEFPQSGHPVGRRAIDQIDACGARAESPGIRYGLAPELPAALVRPPQNLS
jgi:hypothetical protein